MNKLRDELEQLRREKEQLEAQLVCLQRSATLGELLGTTTHEFNNVLMTIMNYAKLGLRNKDEALRDKALSKILAASERAAKISHSVLGMARNRKDSFEPTQLSELISESLLLLERELQHHRVQVESELEKVPDVPVNGNQIQQVLVNLLVNARQAMPEGGGW
jgi:signal transduction histidine kinase